MAEQLLQAVVSGLLIGGVYALVSVGLSIIFGVVKIVNFAQGEFVMLGMYIAYYAWALFGLDPLLAAPLAGLLLFLGGALIQRFLLRRVLSAPDISQIFLTVGLSLLLVNSTLLLAGAQSRNVEVPYSGAAWMVGGVVISLPRLLALVVTLGLALLLALFLKRTDTGRAMRAAAQDMDTAKLMGINTDRIYQIAVGMGLGLAGVAGALVMPFPLYASPTAGQSFGLLAFVVVIVGGMGSLSGAFVVGLLIGVVESLGIQLSSDLGLAFAFLLLLVVLMARPAGLFGRAVA